MKVKLSGLTWMYNPYSLERAFAGIAGAGYNYVSFGLHHEGVEQPDESDAQAARKVRTLLDRYGLKPVTFVCTKQFAPGQPMERAIQQLDVAQELGFEELLTLGTWGYREFPHDPLSPAELAERNEVFADKIGRIAEEAGRRGLIVTLKPHTGNTATSAHLRETIARIGSPYVKASYDPGNVHYYEWIDPAEDFPAIARETVSFVAKDHVGPRGNNSFPCPGAGDVHFPALFRTMYETGFTGPVIVERADIELDIPASAEHADRRMEIVRSELERMLKAAGYEGVL